MGRGERKGRRGEGRSREEGRNEGWERGRMGGVREG